ncbi:hypothetical protein M408DRAFT_23692 [Serendipita vermifera MAFF 305830]|uniref:TRP C-terminal domain-containing protein n=1 Tax=Serendipita vermifera MAFF 305830 TaxID=933852 RepID=A0A0C3AVV8_SERVB|nr:hypothetical protein M408DRAFT_23692 [Serendipita vermifera MAFF 305830]
MAIEAFLGTRAQKAFLFTVIASAVIVFTCVATTYGKVNANFTNDNIPRTVPCYLALFALAVVFEVIVAVDALKLRNTIQLVGILLFHTGMIVMSALQIYQSQMALETTPQLPCTEKFATCAGPGSLFNWILPFLVIIPIVLSLSLIVLIWVARSLYLEFGWAVFHAIGADPKMKVMYQYYQIMICLLKFDFFCFFGVTLQASALWPGLLILIISFEDKKAEFIVTIIAIPVVLGLLILCGLALKREWTILMIFSLTLMIAAESFFIYKLIRVYQPATASVYFQVKGSLTTFIVVSALLLLFTFGVGIRCFADFGQGLRGSKMKDPEQHRKEKAPPVGGASPGMQEQGSIGPGVQRTFSIE